MQIDRRRWQFGVSLLKFLFFAFLLVVCDLAAAEADTELEPLNNAAPFFPEDFNLQPNGPGSSRAKNPSAFTTSGYVEATFYPPHYEYDPNFGRELKDLQVARYALASDVSVFHQSGFFGRLYLNMPLGNTRPQTDYNYKADPILLSFQPTLGYQFTRDLGLRVTYNEAFDLGGFDSKPETQPWLGLSMRYGTDHPMAFQKIAWISGFVEGFIFAPTFEYPATPGASPDDVPTQRFSRDQMVNARYGIELNCRTQFRWKYLDRIFVFAAPKFFFGDSTLKNQNSWSAAPLSVLRELGAGIQLTKHAELRVRHTQFRNLGNAPDGLEALYATGISLRWTW